MALVILLIIYTILVILGKCFLLDRDVINYWNSINRRIWIRWVLLITLPINLLIVFFAIGFAIWSNNKSLEESIENKFYYLYYIPESD